MTEILAHKLMDSRGFLPPHDCHTCGMPLQGADSGHPAELYAGTYTGECYRCQNAPVKTVKTYADGALRLSYAPHCPAWRRNREEYIASRELPERFRSVKLGDTGSTSILASPNLEIVPARKVG